MKPITTLALKLLLSINIFPNLIHATDYLSYPSQSGVIDLYCYETLSSSDSEMSREEMNIEEEESYNSFVSDYNLHDVWGMSDKYVEKGEGVKLSEEGSPIGYASGQESPLDTSLETKCMDEEQDEGKVVEALLQMSYVKGDESPSDLSFDSDRSKEEWEVEVLSTGADFQESSLMIEDLLDLQSISINAEERMLWEHFSKFDYSACENDLLKVFEWGGLVKLPYNHNGAEVRQKRIFEMLSDYFSSTTTRNQITEYSFKLEYYCAETTISYSNLESTAFTVSSVIDPFKRQEFKTAEWNKGKILPFRRYRTEETGILTLTRNIFPLKITVSHFDTRQHRIAVKDSIYNNSTKTKLKWLKKWGPDCKFFLEEKDLFDEEGRQKISKIMVICDKPTSPNTILALKP